MTDHCAPRRVTLAGRNPAGYLFGELLGNPDLDKLYAAIRETGDTGMPRTGIQDLFKRNKSNTEINALLTALAEQDMARPRREQHPSGGRPAEVWVATAIQTTKETTKPSPRSGFRGMLVSFVPGDTIGDTDHGDAWERELSGMIYLATAEEQPP